MTGMGKGGAMRRRHWAAGALLAAMALPAAGQEAQTGWGYNTFGTPGLIDMPAAFGRPDAELGFITSHFRNQTRTALTFQISKRLSASFRYAFLYDIRPYLDDPTVWDFRFDRSFSLHYRFADEGRYMPALAVGLNDLVGTGLYGGEYVVASKTLRPDLRATIGIGWGRLGTVGGFSNPLGVLGDRFKTRGKRSNGFGGTFEPSLWFHGDAAFFGGIEWMVNDRLRFTAEYSSDDYAREDGSAFDRRTPFNFGLSWQANDRTTVSANYLYGSELGLQVDYALNPKRSRHGSGNEPAPPPVLPRSAAGPASWHDLGEGAFVRRLGQGLDREGLTLEGVEVAGKRVSIAVENTRYGISAQALGRAARVLSRTAPAEAERFEIVLGQNGMPVTSVTLRRSDLEELEFHPVAPDLLRVNTVILDRATRLPVAEGRYPAFSYGLDPYLTPSFFDPDDPLRADLGLALGGRFEPLPGLVFSGRIQQKIAGNLDKGTRPSTSVLPHVRSDAYLYYKGGDTTIQELTGAWYFRPGKDLFGRVTVGYLETMYGGISAELLWKPQNSALALGIEANHVRQRDFDQRFGFQDYSVTTGHISAYYEFGGGYQGQLDIGRYLAGDIGATLALNREFDNGWRVGVFATKTDVPAADFGEGSFDKGIRLTIPLDWATGRPSRTKIDTVLRPVQRDGGARLNVPGRLYETVRGLQATELDASWGRFWR